MSRSASIGSMHSRVRCLQGCRGRPWCRNTGATSGCGPRVSGRLPHRAGALWRGTPWLPVVSREGGGDRPAVHSVRIQRQAGPGQHPLRSISCRAFWHFFKTPRASARSTTWGADSTSNCSVLEAITMVERLTGRALGVDLLPTSGRAGDHIWWVSDVRKFASHYPGLDPHLFPRSRSRRDLRGGRRA